MIHDALRVIESCGIQETNMSALNANLGISFSKTTYFSKRVMEEYIRWTTDRFDKMLIIVADHLEAFNVQVFKGYSFVEACERTLNTGRELRTGYLRAVPTALAPRVTVSLASDVLQEPGCSSLAAVVRQTGASEPAFGADLKAAVGTGLAGKLEEAKSAGIRIDDGAMDILQNYLIEEIAIILYLSHLAPTRYPVLIFPHFIPAVIPRIYAEQYSSIFGKITRGQPLRAVQVVSEGRPQRTSAEKG